MLVNTTYFFFFFLMVSGKFSLTDILIKKKYLQCCYNVISPFLTLNSNTTYLCYLQTALKNTKLRSSIAISIITIIFDVFANLKVLGVTPKRRTLYLICFLFRKVLVESKVHIYVPSSYDNITGSSFSVFFQDPIGAYHGTNNNAAEPAVPNHCIHLRISTFKSYNFNQLPFIHY